MTSREPDDRTWREKIVSFAVGAPMTHTTLCVLSQIEREIRMEGEANRKETAELIEAVILVNQYKLQIVTVMEEAKERDRILAHFDGRRIAYTD